MDGKDVHASELYDMSVELSVSLLRVSWFIPNGQWFFALPPSHVFLLSLSPLPHPQQDLQRLILEQHASAHDNWSIVNASCRAQEDHRTPCVLGAALSVQLLIQPETLEEEQLSNRAEDAGEDASSS